MKTHRARQTALLIDRRMRRLTHQHTGKGQRARQGAAVLVLAAVILFTGLIGALGLTAVSLTSDLPSLDLLPFYLDSMNGQLLQPSRLYDRSGQNLILSLENPGIPRRYLPVDPALPEHFSPQFVQTVLAVIDPNFWTHSGFRMGRLGAAAPQTIAERLASDLLLESEPSGLRRAVRMRLLAAQMTARFGRARILEWYLNSAYFGHLAYGADSAARLYLGKPAENLDLAESALLVAILDAPALNPIDAPGAVADRQKTVLKQMAAQGLISAESAEKAEMTVEPVPLSAESKEPIAPAFIRLVMDDLTHQLGRQRVERGGLKVITTLDLDLQKQVECAAAVQLSRLQGGATGDPACDAARLLPTLSSTFETPKTDVPLAVSAAVMDVDTGQVRALIGELSSEGQRTNQIRRPPGSLASPFLAVTAFARGFSPASLVWDLPDRLPEELSGMQNPDGRYHGPQRLRTALVNDYLTALTALLVQLGPTNVWSEAEALGLKGFSGVEEPTSVLFKDGAVTPLEAARAYSLFASQGVRSGVNRGGENSAVVVLRVEDHTGQPLSALTNIERQPVLSADIAYLVHHMLADEPARWVSLGYPNPLEIGRPAGAKIGRTAAGQDTWAVGYTRQTAAAVWLGVSVNAEEIQKSGGAVSPDAKAAAGIWHAVLQYADRNQPVLDWQIPPGVNFLEVCDPSGKLMTRDCPSSVREVFAAGSEPVEYDNLYQVVQVNRETGRLATVFTPLELVEQKTFLALPQDARAWAEEAKVPLAPNDYDSIQVPPVNPNVQITAPQLFGYVRGEVVLAGTARGVDFSAYRVQVGQGLNPRSWIQVGADGTTSVDEGQLQIWDTREITDGLYAVKLSVVHEDQRLESAIIQVTVDNTAPQAAIVAPQPGQRFNYLSDRRITLQLTTSDAVGIDRVEWLVDGQPIGSSRQEPFAWVWETSRGEHAVSARVVDLAGNFTQTQVVKFSVTR